MGKTAIQSTKTVTKKATRKRKQRISPSIEYDRPIFRTRLLMVMKARGTNQRQVALGIGRDPRQLSLVCISKHKPDLQMLAALGEHLNISVDWLLSIGKRPTLQEANGPDATVTFKLNGNPELPITLPKALVKKTFADASKVTLISVAGSDMAPHFRDGDLAFVQRTGFQNKAGCYLINAAGTETIRRVSFDPVQSKVTLWAEATKDEKLTLPLSKVKIIGIVHRVEYLPG